MGRQADPFRNRPGLLWKLGGSIKIRVVPDGHLDDPRRPTGRWAGQLDDATGWAIRRLQASGNEEVHKGVHG